jgi:hypothetical protein
LLGLIFGQPLSRPAGLHLAASKLRAGPDHAGRRPVRSRNGNTGHGRNIGVGRPCRRNMSPATACPDAIFPRRHDGWWQTRPEAMRSRSPSPHNEPGRQRSRQGRVRQCGGGRKSASSRGFSGRRTRSMKARVSVFRRDGRISRCASLTKKFWLAGGARFEPTLAESEFEDLPRRWSPGITKTRIWPCFPFSRVRQYRRQYAFR